jgi:hypothetical protein
MKEPEGGGGGGLLPQGSAVESLENPSGIALLPRAQPKYYQDPVSSMCFC